MLIIPTIALQNGTATFPSTSTAEGISSAFSDPLKMAKLWRVQNAQSLFIYDLDAAFSDKNNYLTIQAICQALDIPVMVSGGVRRAEAVEALLRMGAQKVIVEATTLAHITDILAQFPKHRLGFHLILNEQFKLRDPFELDALAYIQFLDKNRCARAFCTVCNEDWHAIFAPEIYTQLASSLHHMKLSITGGIRHYADLRQLQQLHPRLDSAILYRSLYQNAFPCQAIWAWHQKEMLNLDNFSTAILRPNS